MITHNIVSLYICHHYGHNTNSSIIKFGGWDKEGILDNDPTKMTMIKTMGGLCWGADEQVRRGLDLPPYGPDPGTFRRGDAA